jgi:hypothetical protein
MARENHQEKTFLGSNKVVRTFEHQDKDGVFRKYVRIESQKGWTKEEALATFHMARLAFLIFPDNIPYPRLVRENREGGKKGKYSMFAEFIPHDVIHDYLTQHRNKHGGYVSSRHDVIGRRTFFDYKVKVEDDSDFIDLKKEMIKAGLVGRAGEVSTAFYEVSGANVIKKDGRYYFVDFRSPFEEKECSPRYLKFDLERFKKYVTEKFKGDKYRLELIQTELFRLANSTPEHLREEYKKLFTL